MDALETLMDEHLTIATTLGLLDVSAKKMQGGEELPTEFFDEVMDILENFADRCHHAKEEEVLFPLFKGNGAKDSEAVSSFLEEHENGRAFVSALGKAVDRDDRLGIMENASGYYSLMSQHIRKENMLFPAWIKSLSDAASEEMAARFDRIEARSLGPERHQEYRRTVERLKSEILS